MMENFGMPVSHAHGLDRSADPFTRDLYLEPYVGMTEVDLVNAEIQKLKYEGEMRRRRRTMISEDDDADKVSK